MNAEIQDYISKHSIELQSVFAELREQIIISVPHEIEERL